MQPKPILLTTEQAEHARKRLATEVVEEIRVPELGPCAVWQGSKNEKGYGEICLLDGKKAKAHRVAFVLTHGDTDLFVCHRCDQPDCVRLDHLFAGTKLDNMRDCATKGRTVYQRRPELAPRGERHGSQTHPERIRRGEGHPNAKLGNAQVVEIRRRFAAGERQCKLAKEFGVRQCTISEIVRRKTYATAS